MWGSDQAYYPAKVICLCAHMWYALMSGSLVNLVALLNQHSASFSPLSFKLHAKYHDISMLMNAMGTQGQCLSLLAQHQAFLLEKLANSSSSPHILWHLSAGKGTSTHHSCSINPQDRKYQQVIPMLSSNYTANLGRQLKLEPRGKGGWWQVSTAKIHWRPHESWQFTPHFQVTQHVLHVFHASIDASAFGSSYIVC